MRKRSVLFVAAMSLFAVASCHKDVAGADTEGNSDAQLAVEMVSEKQVETSNEFINEVDYADFINAEVKQLMDASPLYARASRSGKLGARTRSGEENTADTMFAAQIPVCELISEETKIFLNGEMETVYESAIDPEGNPALAFHAEPIDLNQFIARIETKDGQRISYNKSGDVLHSEPAEQPDMKGFLEELQGFVKQVEEEGLATRGSKRDIEWLKAQMALQPQTRSGATPYWRAEQLPNGNVILEQEVVGGDASAHTRGIVSGKLLTRTELSPDITRTMGFELRSGELLLERRTYKYSESNSKTRSLYAPEALGANINPEQIISERLVFLGDATPMVEVKTENFSQNQTIFHFNKK